MSLKVIFITPYPHGEAPSQRFRFEQYLKFLDEHEVSYCLHPFLNRKGWTNLYSRGGGVRKSYYLIIGFLKRFFILFKVPFYNYIFIHREATPLGPPIFEWIVAKALRRKIIYDFDDAIWLEDPLERGTFLSMLKWKSKVRLICQWSHKISVGNDFLAQYARKFNSNTVLIPTTIDTESVHNPSLYERAKNTIPVIGWTGTHSTLHYLEQILPVIRKLESQHNFQFLVISNKKPHFDLKSLKYIKWNKKTEIQDLLKIDIGLMPLTNDLWSSGKCGFKALQYMALKIPALVSPVGVNNRIVQHEVNGYICSLEEDWEQRILELIEKPDIMIKIGEEGRTTVVKYYSVSSTRSAFLSLFGLA